MNFDMHPGLLPTAVGWLGCVAKGFETRPKGPHPAYLRAAVQRCVSSERGGASALLSWSAIAQSTPNGRYTCACRQPHGSLNNFAPGLCKAVRPC